MGKVERHIRFFSPLAFLPPRIVEAIASGSVPTPMIGRQGRNAAPDTMLHMSASHPENPYRPHAPQSPRPAPLESPHLGCRRLS